MSNQVVVWSMQAHNDIEGIQQPGLASVFIYTRGCVGRLHQKSHLRAIEGNDDPMHLCRCSTNRVEESTFPIICHTYSASEVETCKRRTTSLTLRIHRLTGNRERLPSGAQMNSTYLLREAYRTSHLGKNRGIAAWQM
jgi:hypothetical protein